MRPPYNWRAINATVIDRRYNSIRFDSSRSVSRNPPGSPGGLEIEAARDAVNVEQLPGKIEIWRDPAFHGFEIDLA